MKDFIKWLKSEIVSHIVVGILFGMGMSSLYAIPMFFSKTQPVITTLGNWLELTMILGVPYGIATGYFEVTNFFATQKAFRAFWGSDSSGLREINEGDIWRSVDGTRQARFTRLKPEEAKSAIISSDFVKQPSFKDRLTPWRTAFDLEKLKLLPFKKHIEELDPVTELVTVSYIQRMDDLERATAINYPNFLKQIGTTDELQWVAQIIPNTTVPTKPRFFWGDHPGLSISKKEPPPSTPLPNPQILLIEPRPDGIYLFRLTAGGEYAGDTWHQSEAEARNQAAYEYRDRLGPWREVPPEVRGIEAIIAFTTSSQSKV